MSYEEMQDRFIRDVENFELTVEHDEGVFRHLKCRNKNGSSNQFFTVTTYPNHLAINGDMGSNSFSRVFDMFEFFNNKISDGINVGYWHEKCLNENRVHSQDRVEAFIENRKKQIEQDVLNLEYEESFTKYKEQSGDHTTIEDFAGYVVEEIEAHFECKDLDEYRFITALEDYDSDLIEGLSFSDDLEDLSSEKIKPRFIWQCWAIVWAIEQYRIYEAKK